mmetsp:Transcript_55371/g.63583  ORF Transcript_55371/g.63583 Transcript_55371/m.63583 type:complete len:203 (+) Transcript_55371:51-659(+)
MLPADETSGIVTGVVVSPSAIPSVAPIVIGTVVEEVVALTTSTTKQQEDAAKAKQEGMISFAFHVLTAEDEHLASLALRYGSTVEDIMKCNHMIHRDLDLLPLGCVLRIPLTHEAAVYYGKHKQHHSLRHEKEVTTQAQQLMVRDFAVKMNCSKEEARYYLEVADFDVKSAEQQLREDLAWESHHRAASLKSHVAAGSVAGR